MINYSFFICNILYEPVKMQIDCFSMTALQESNLDSYYIDLFIGIIYCRIQILSLWRRSINGLI